MSRDEAGAWAATVRALAERLGARYDPVGGLNPAGGPAALCPGGTNRITGQLARRLLGGVVRCRRARAGAPVLETVLPDAVLAKAHMPDLARVVPLFNVESLERDAEDLVEKRVTRRTVEFESIEFNKRFLTTVPSEYDPVALRELFSPGFLDWVARISNEIDFGITDRQLYFMWRLRERTGDEYEAALDNAGQLFRAFAARWRSTASTPMRPALARRPRALPGRLGLGGLQRSRAVR